MNQIKKIQLNKNLNLNQKNINLLRNFPIYNTDKFLEK